MLTSHRFSGYCRVVRGVSGRPRIFAHPFPPYPVSTSSTMEHMGAPWSMSEHYRQTLKVLITLHKKRPPRNIYCILHLNIRQIRKSDTPKIAERADLEFASKYLSYCFYWISVRYSFCGVGRRPPPQGKNCRQPKTRNRGPNPFHLAKA